MEGGNALSYTIDHTGQTSDSLILEHYGLNELNFESVKNYRQRFAAVKPDHPWNALELKEFLYKIGAWGKIRNTNKEGLTLAGLLMFSEERMITEVLPQYFLEYRESLGNNENLSWSHRFTSQDGTWSGNIYDFYFRTLDNIRNSMSGDLGVEQATIFHEAIINAIVHGDYYAEGGIVIEKTQDAYIFTNPGYSRVAAEQALEGGISNLRNPNLFKMFIMIDLCKRAGSGIRNMDVAAKQLNWIMRFTSDSENNKTNLTLKIYPMIVPIEEAFLSGWQENEDSYTNGRNSDNKDYNSYNKVKNSYNNDFNSANKDVISVNKEFGSDNKDYNSYNKDIVGNSESTRSINNKMKDSVEVPSTEDIYEEVLEDDIEAELWQIAELARKKKRLSPDVMEDIILQLCAKRPLRLKEFAYLLERTPDGLRNNYLAKLLDKGKIKLKYPNQVNHPKQAYVIK
ncbi:transcriptional regulator [Ectobacillus sp. JY-23]|uniref:ATP-binding protein n=1 Tax=Ectobacillus sp. JY-23 TaxID=2933872 RepID=UPI001FF348DA|nr:ATP-binding protein [Ectobacillus sp. JY-23]UOY94546.1 transcriptional regulator [Ectobacillus sp. JY-23]